MKRKALAVFSHTMPREASGKLEELGFECVILGDHPLLPSPTASHADMIFSVIGNRVFTDIHGEKLIASFTERCGIEVTVCLKTLSEKYPDDTAFNVLCTEDMKIFCRKSSCAPEIIKYAEENGFLISDVKQGYSACSTLAAKDFAVTADPSMAKALDVLCGCLRISEGAISLPPYDTGFIGGASGYFEGVSYFAGDIMTHPDGDMIVRYLAEHGVESISLCEGELSDVGGIKFFYEKQ